MALEALVIRQDKIFTANPTLTLAVTHPAHPDFTGRTEGWTSSTIDRPAPSDTPEEMRQESSNVPMDEPSETTVFDVATFTNLATTKTDSGKTVTVPNNEVVTVTRHTLIITDKPPALPTTLSTITTSGFPGETPSTPGENGTASGNEGPALATGTLVGISVGGAILIAALVVLALFLKKRRKKQREESGSAGTNDSGRDEGVEEKHFPKMSPHTTGTQVEDPFAPFGGKRFPLNHPRGLTNTHGVGRVDKEEDFPQRPPSNVFEMDATNAAPVELPAISPGANPRPRSSSPEDIKIFPVGESPADPQATLNSLGKERYVNHWNQYKNLGSG